MIKNNLKYTYKVKMTFVNPDKNYILYETTVINELTPHVFVSNWERSNNPKIMEMFDIKAVLTIETMPKPAQIIKYYKDNNINFLYLSLVDKPTENIYKYFDISYEFINKHTSKGENVLVHCAAGVSRSVTLVLNYMIRKLYETKYINACPCVVMRHVLNNARERRPIINPNDGFMNQLLEKTIQYDLQNKKK